MIDTKKISQMVRHIIRRDRGVSDTNIMHPTREWALGLFGAFLLVSAGAAFSTIFYVTYDSSSIEDVSVEQTVPTYQAVPIGKAIEAYRNESNRHQESISLLEQGAVSTGSEPDPSGTEDPIVPDPDDDEPVENNPPDSTATLQSF